jgi:hypothetical protein
VVHGDTAGLALRSTISLIRSAGHVAPRPIQRRSAVRRRPWCRGAIAFLCVILKLFPVFCVSHAARSSKQTFLFACALATFSLILCFIAWLQGDLTWSGSNTERSGSDALGLADTWVPAATGAFVLSPRYCIGCALAEWECKGSFDVPFASAVPRLALVFRYGVLMLNFQRSALFFRP